MTEGGTRTRIGLFAAFGGLGVTAAFVPALLPSAERDLDADLSIAVPVLFAGLLVGVLASGPLLARRPPRTTLLLGSTLQLLALVTTAWTADAAVFVAAAALAGLGFGLVEAAGSVAAKAASTGSATGLLSALLGTVAVCAAATPLLVALGGGTRPALALLATVPLLTVVLLAVPVPRATPTAAETAATAAAAAATAPAAATAAAAAAATTAPAAAAAAAATAAATGAVGRDPRTLLALLPFALALPLYVGVETVLSGWSAVIPERVLAVDPAVAALGTSAFWALMAMGRFTAAALRRAAVPPLALLTTGTAGAAVLMAGAGLLVTLHPVWALAALGLVVVLLAPSYGLILGLALDRLDPARSAAAVGALVACGAVGGTFVPTLVLLLGRDPASSTTFLVAAALCACVPVLMLAASRSRQRAETTA